MDPRFDGSLWTTVDGVVLSEVGSLFWGVFLPVFTFVVSLVLYWPQRARLSVDVEKSSQVSNVRSLYIF